jgi:hypothetical protein
LVRLDVETLDRSITDPNFTALLHEGWMPLATLAVEEGARPVLVVVLRPPQPPPPPRHQLLTAPLLAAAGAFLAALVAALLQVR